VKDLACGNNCTLVLVGSSGPPSLQELCIESMAANYHYYHGYGACTMLQHTFDRRLVPG
jgi:hypothetical protein